MPPPPPAMQAPATAAAPPAGSRILAASGSPGWEARLELRFDASADGVTRLAHNRHAGPLRLLKALASGDRRRLEAVVVHPPGGLVGGDTLAIALDVLAAARVLVTTPGQQKWYRGEMPSVACTRITLAAGARLEWLPQPAILFDQAQARQSLAIDMDASASCTGWEVLVRGRAAMGEQIAGGHIDQVLSISVGQRLLWQERLRAEGCDRIFGSPLGWSGRRMAASVWCCAPALTADRLRDLRDQWRSQLAAWDEVALDDGTGGPRGGATLAADGLLLAKILADDSEQLMSLCRSLWRTARITLEGDEGSEPRIWRT